MTDQKNTNQTTAKKDLNRKILDNIQHQTPRSKTYFMGLNLFLSSLILGLLLSLGLLTGFAIWDTLSVASSGLDFILFEVFGLILILLIALFWLYRQTDFLLVKHRALVFSALAFGVLLVGILVVIFSQQNPAVERNFETFQGGIETLPHRQNRGRMMGKRMQKDGIFRGRIVQIITEIDQVDLRENGILRPPKDGLQDYSLIQIQNRRETRTFLIKNQLLDELKRESNQRARAREFRVDFESGEVLGVG